MSDTPSHWNWTTLEEVGEWTGGGTPSKRKQSYWTGGTVPWVSPKDMKTDQIQDTQDHLTQKALEESSSAKSAPAGSVLFVTRSGILEHTLPTALTEVEATINQDLKALIPGEQIDAKFLLYYTQAEELPILRACSKDGTTVASLESSKLYAYPIPVPPLAEQRRIVAKIEELLTGLDAGVADLERAQRQLARYRRSVLAAAVRGRLTAAWRANHDAEPAGAKTLRGSSLLERILGERRRQWEADYRAKYAAKGKQPPSGWKSRYTPPEAPDTDGLAALPDGWVWTNTEHIGKIITGSTPKTSVEEYYGGEYPFYRPGDLDTGFQTHSAEKTLTEAGMKEARFLAAESTLVTCIGGTIGKTGLIHEAGASNQQINALTPYEPLLPHYAYFVCVSPQFQNRIHERSSSTTMPILNKGKFQALPFPLPPLEEQRQIVSEVERLLSVADEAARTVERERTRAERLRQSILKEAFAGRLVEASGDDAGGGAEREARERVGAERSNASAGADGTQVEMSFG